MTAPIPYATERIVRVLERTSACRPRSSWSGDTSGCFPSWRGWWPARFRRRQPHADPLPARARRTGAHRVGGTRGAPRRSWTATGVDADLLPRPAWVSQSLPRARGPDLRLPRLRLDLRRVGQRPSRPRCDPRSHASWTSDRGPCSCSTTATATIPSATAARPRRRCPASSRMPRDGIRVSVARPVPIA